MQVTRDGAHGELTLVDLAGSERSVDSAEHNAEQTKQSAQINASLAVLKECLRCLCMPPLARAGMLLIAHSAAQACCRAARMAD